jgi:hypothetical protein
MKGHARHDRTICALMTLASGAHGLHRLPFSRVQSVGIQIRRDNNPKAVRVSLLRIGNNCNVFDVRIFFLHPCLRRPDPGRDLHDDGLHGQGYRGRIRVAHPLHTRALEFAAAHVPLRCLLSSKPFCSRMAAWGHELKERLRGEHIRGSFEC